MKRTISLLLVCCMLAVMLPAASAKATASVPSIEDILNDYHAKAFAAQHSGESGGVSAYSRSGVIMKLTVTASRYLHTMSQHIDS